ncbi:MAG: hypothetical protein U9N57_01255 [Pseudomonadota bacterium]|nr:hypothetical protein [Pseudomonadota bacterium]
MNTFDPQNTQGTEVEMSIQQSLKNLSKANTVLGNKTPPQSVMLTVHDYDLSNQARPMVIGAPVDRPEDVMRIWLYQSQDPNNQINRAKEIPNFAQDPEGVQLSVRTLAGGVILFEGVYRQEDGTFAARYASRVSPDVNNGMAAYSMCHEEMVAKGNPNSANIDVRLIIPALLESEDKHEKHLGTVLSSYLSQNPDFKFVGIDALANAIGSSDTLDPDTQQPMFTVDSATDLLQRLASANFILKDPELAKEYKEHAAYRVSILKPEEAVIVSNDLEMQQALQKALSCPENSESLHGKVAGYTPKAVIRATDGQYSQTYEVNASGSMKGGIFKYTPVNDMVNQAMQSALVSGLMDLMRGSSALSRSLQVEVIPARTYSALQRTKEKLQDFHVEEIIKKGYDAQGEKLWAKQYVGMRFLAKYNKLHPVHVSQKSEQALRSTQTTINNLITDNIRPNIATAQVQTIQPVDSTIQQPVMNAEQNHKPSQAFQQPAEQAHNPSPVTSSVNQTGHYPTMQPSTVDTPDSFSPPFQSDFDPNEFEGMEGMMTENPAPTSESNAQPKKPGVSM